MTTYRESKSSVRLVFEMLRAELAWYPGRGALVARMAVACVSVMVLAVVFRIPGSALGASFPILISRETPKASRKSAFDIGIACSIGTAEIIVGGMLTAGSPFLHVMWVLGTLFAAFYAISKLNFTSASLTVSAVIAIGIQVWEYPVSAESRVEHTLYTLLSILIACVVSASIETMRAAKDAPDAVLSGIYRRMSLVEAVLNQGAAAAMSSTTLRIQISRSASRGVDDLWRLLLSSGYDEEFRELVGAMIALTDQLMELASSLAESASILSIEDRECCRIITGRIDSIRSGLDHRQAADWAGPPLTNRRGNSVVLEMERTSDLMVRCFFDKKLRLFFAVPATQGVAMPVAQIAQSPEHMRFAVRGTLAAFVCYLFYMGTGWLGLGASIITCTLTARRSTGASRHRQSLRFAGFIVGAGVIGFGTQALILPHVDSIAGYVLVFASVIWIGSWMATSGPRIAYSGFQLVLAYCLVNLNRFAVYTSLVPSRDTILGVVLGVIAMWLVFDHLWAESSVLAVRNLLSGTLRRIADLKETPAESPREVNRWLAAARSLVNRNFDELRDLADLYVFESFPKKVHESLLNRMIRTALPELRVFLHVKAGLLQHGSVTAGAAEGALLRDVETMTSGVLRGLADVIEGEAQAALLLRDTRADELRARVIVEEERSRALSDPEKETEMRLCLSLMDSALDLERRVRLNFVPDPGD